MTPVASMKSAYASGAPAHSAARKKATIAPAMPTGTGLYSGHARHTAAAKAAASIRRPMNGVGGERSHQKSSELRSGERPIHAMSTPSAASSASHAYEAR